MTTVPITQTMPSAAVRAFTDPGEYQTFTCDAQHSVVLTERGLYRAQTTRLDLHRIIMRRAWQSLPTVSHLAIPAGRSAICFPLDADRSPTTWRGIEVRPGEMFVVHSGGDFHSRSDKDARWASVSMASDTLSRYIEAVAGADPGLTDVAHVRPRPAAMARLLAIHQAAGDLVETAPDVLLRPEVARVFEDNLMVAVVDCLTDAEMLKIRRASGCQTMRRFEELLESDPDRILHLVDVCSAIDVSERTLRLHCIEHLRMSPYRYLQLRRMHQVRRALAHADVRSVTVTEMATHHGFWELGRFSVAYKKVFGESPSTTLRRATGGSASV